MQSIIQPKLAQEIRRQSGENVFLCYQCQKCSSGCPVAEHFDLAPNQVIRAIQLGRRDIVLQSKTIWLCAMCETCAVRCPHDINITRIMDVLKIMAQAEGITISVPSVTFFNKAALRGIRWFGRMYEAGLMGEIYIRQMMTGKLNLKQFVQWDLPLALKMIRHRKLKLLPSPATSRVKRSPSIRNDAIAYYPGCSLHGTSREYDASTRAVFTKLGAELVEPEGWSCCGSTPAHSTDHYLSVLLPVKNIVKIQKQGFQRITTPCPSCFLRLRSGLIESREESTKKRLLAEIGELPSSDVSVDHILQTLVDRIGFDKVAKKVVRPLKGMKVVCYYGCIITRPPKITGVKEYEYPLQMDKLMELLGAEPLDWSYKTRCCGASLAISQLRIALELTGKILQNAKEVGAEAIVVACPLCQVNLDARQQQIADEKKLEYQLPIIYFTQLMGLAFGMDCRELELDRHFVDPSLLIKKLGLAECMGQA